MRPSFPSYHAIESNRSRRRAQWGVEQGVVGRMSTHLGLSSSDRGLTHRRKHGKYLACFCPILPSRCLSHHVLASLLATQMAIFGVKGKDRNARTQDPQFPGAVYG